MTTTPANGPTTRELEAIDAIFHAYMACNAADANRPSPLAHENSVGLYPTPMAYLAAAGRAAWQAIGLPETYWNEMVSCGENATYVHHYYAENPA